MFHVLICDDDKAVCAMLEEYILAYQSHFAEKMDIEVFERGEELCSYLAQGNLADLLFLDISLTDMDGVSVGHYIREVLRNEALHVVYISGREDYCTKLFDVRPMQFHLKPIQKEKVYADLKKAMYLSGVLHQTFLYQKGKMIERVTIDQILYFESVGRKVKLVMISKTDEFYATMQGIWKKLNCYRFLQPHRSYIVNYDHVIRIKNDEIEMTNGNRIPVARSNWNEIKAKQLRYEMFGE